MVSHQDHGGRGQAGSLSPLGQPALGGWGQPQTASGADDHGLALLRLLGRVFLPLRQLPVHGDGLGRKRRELFGTAVPGDGAVTKEVRVVAGTPWDPWSLCKTSGGRGPQVPGALSLPEHQDPCEQPNASPPLVQGRPSA